jgi:nucleoside-diphosphate-sugar epimerase
MASVKKGKVVIFGAGGPVGAAAIQALKDHYTLRVTDLKPMAQIAASPSPQGPRAPVPELLGPPHENRVVDITQYEQVLEACKGMQAAINLTVVRPDPVLAFAVSMVGAFNLARAAAACGLKRLIHTGPYHTRMGHEADHWNDFRVVPEAPLHPGDDLYALTKYLGLHLTDCFARERGLEVLTYLFCSFRPRRIAPEDLGKGVHPFVTSWEDTGEAFLCGLRAPRMPSPHEVFFICADLPHGKYRADKAWRLLKWKARDTFEELYTRR